MKKQKKVSFERQLIIDLMQLIISRIRAYDWLLSLYMRNGVGADVKLREVLNQREKGDIDKFVYVYVPAVTKTIVSQPLAVSKETTGGLRALDFNQSNSNVFGSFRGCGSTFTGERIRGDATYGAKQLTDFSMGRDVATKQAIANVGMPWKSDSLTRILKPFDPYEQDKWWEDMLISLGKQQLLEAMKKLNFSTIIRALRVNMSWMFGMMQHESGLNEEAINKAGTDHIVAYGLIQFTESGARSVGSTVADLKRLGLEFQLSMILRFYENLFKKMAPRHFGDVKKANFMPASLGWQDDVVLFSLGSKAYRQNPSADFDGDGHVTVADLNMRVLEFIEQLKKGRGIQHVEIGKRL